MILKLPTVFFIVAMLPFFSMMIAFTGYVPAFMHSLEFVWLVFGGFKAAAMFAALAFITLPFHQ